MLLAIALMLALTTACAAPQSAPTTPLPAGTSTAPPTSADSARPSPATPTRPAPSSGTLVHASDGLETFALGALSGEVAFVTRNARRGTAGFPIYKELWAVPLDGSPPRLSAIYRAVFDARMADTNVLARQFSPDGRRLLLSVGIGPIDPAYQIVVLDLATGIVTRLLSDPPLRSHERSPAWSPDGARVAFSRRIYPTQGIDGEIWVVGADGRDAKRLRGSFQGAGTTVWGWTADSALIGFDPVGFESAGYALIDLDGKVTRVTDGSVTSPAPVSWRSRAPAFAGSFGDTPRPSRTDLLIADAPGAAVRVVLSLPADGLTDPRWDPSGRNVLIYRQKIPAPSTTYVHDLGTGARKSFGSLVSWAEWTPSGDRIVTVEEHPSTGPETVYVWSRDGQLLRGQLALPPDATGSRIYDLEDLAVRGY